MPFVFSNLTVPDYDSKTCILPRTVAAIQTTAYPVAPQQLGIVVRLPEGAKLTLLGAGFNDRTVKVRSQEAVYFVFLEDLQKDIQDLWTASVRREYPVSV